MRDAKKLWLCYLIVAVPCLLFSALLPYFPVDETRYLSVAWEMKVNNSFIVPLQNGLPYSHKPPFLFWLVNLNWLVFGVNERSLRLIPLLFSLLNITLLYRIALKLWDDEGIARCAALMLSATCSYLLWSSLIMFDMLLSFWVLLGLWALLEAGSCTSVKPWLLFAASVGGGLLTKGPVLLVYLLPVALCPFLWVPGRHPGYLWYLKLSLSLILGGSVVLAWAAPAVANGGEAYREAILWGQTVNRMADSFAHKRPLWWYLPRLPVLLFPWVLIPAAWRLRWPLQQEPGSRFACIWGGCTLLIFSLISGKQFHYLIPALPAFILLMARSLASCEGELSVVWRRIPATFYLLLGGVAIVLPLTTYGIAVAKSGFTGFPALACGSLAIGGVLLATIGRSVSSLVNSTAVASVALCAVVFHSDAPFFLRYDLHGIARQISERQQEGYSIVHLGKYHGQYQFMGRLKKPLVVMNDIGEVARYAAGKEKVALISYQPLASTVGPEGVLYQQPFRNKTVVLWDKAGIASLLGAGPSLRQVGQRVAGKGVPDVASSTSTATAAIRHQHE